MSTFTVSTPRSFDPVTLEEAKAFARVDTSADDGLITQLITASTDFALTYTNRIFLDTTYTYATDSFYGSCLIFPKGDIDTVVSISYYDESDVLNLIASSVYSTDFNTVYTTVYLAENEEWPTDLNRFRPFPVVAVVSGGVALAADVPEQVKTFIKMMVTDMYEHRMTNIEDETRVNKTSLMLLNNLRVPYI